MAHLSQSCQLSSASLIAIGIQENKVWLALTFEEKCARTAHLSGIFAQDNSHTYIWGVYLDYLGLLRIGQLELYLI